MNPSELVKGCGRKDLWDYICGVDGYCPLCKARMEQALFMLNNYCFCELAIHKITNDIEILEKALNIHSLALPDSYRRDSQQMVEDAKWKHPNLASSAEQTSATSIKLSENNQGVKE